MRKQIVTESIKVLSFCQTLLLEKIFSNSRKFFFAFQICSTSLSKVSTWSQISIVKLAKPMYYGIQTVQYIVQKRVNIRSFCTWKEQTSQAKRSRRTTHNTHMEERSSSTSGVDCPIVKLNGVVDELWGYMSSPNDVGYKLDLAEVLLCMCLTNRGLIE